MKPDPTKIQYMPVYFNRNSVITFEKDQPVFLPEDNGGTTWVYKNYTNTVDPTLTYEDLPKLDKRLKSLPAGYKFRTKTLDRDLIIKVSMGRCESCGTNGEVPGMRWIPRGQLPAVDGISLIFKKKYSPKTRMHGPAALGCMACLYNFILSCAILTGHSLFAW